MPTSTLFRSEEMSFIQLYIPNEVCQPTVAELGELGLVQFRDVCQFLQLSMIRRVLAFKDCGVARPPRNWAVKEC